jgi:hypothetical protein
MKIRAYGSKASAFFKDSSVVGQNYKKGPFSLPSLQDSMRSPKVWAECRSHELVRGDWGHAPQEIFKIWVSEIAFPAFWEHILKKSQLLKTKF